MAEVEEGMTLLTPKGTVLAYTFLTVTALTTIFFGASRSVKFYKEAKQTKKQLEELLQNVDNMNKSAMTILWRVVIFLSPVVVLVIFREEKRKVAMSLKTFPSEFVNELVDHAKLALILFAVLSVTYLVRPLLRRCFSETKDYHFRLRLQLTQNVEGVLLKRLLDDYFSLQGFLTFAISVPIGLSYLWYKHWIANNLLGMASAVVLLEMSLLPNLQPKSALSVGFMWVLVNFVDFVPFNLVFPQDMLSLQSFFSPGSGDSFAMLRLADIVIPGIFIAFLRRFDVSRGFQNCTYFHTSFIAYAVGLLVAFSSKMLQNRDVRPACYLVPLCFGFGIPLAFAVVEGELKALFKYDEEKAEEKVEESSVSSVSSESNEEEINSSNSINPHYSHLICQ